MRLPGTCSLLYGVLTWSWSFLRISCLNFTVASYSYLFFYLEIFVLYFYLFSFFFLNFLQIHLCENLNNTCAYYNL